MLSLMEDLLWKPIPKWKPFSRISNSTALDYVID